MKALLIWAICFTFVWWYFGSEKAVILGSGVKVEMAPVQSKVDNIKPFQFKNYTITPLAKIELSAKVLSKKNYSSLTHGEAKLSPVDLALGWQNMSDEEVLSQINISQSNRFYRWRVKQYPIPRSEIISQSANMHMVPANSLIEDMLNDTKEGQIVSISGYLIRADAENLHWKSSLTRKDSGGGACELVFVEEFNIVE